MFSQELYKLTQSQAQPSTLTLNSQHLGIMCLDDALFEHFLDILEHSETLEYVVWRVAPISNGQFQNLNSNIKLAYSEQDHNELNRLRYLIPQTPAMRAVIRSIAARDLEQLAVDLKYIDDANDERFKRLCHCLYFNCSITEFDFSHSPLHTLGTLFNDWTRILARDSTQQLDLSHCHLASALQEGSNRTQKLCLHLASAQKLRALDLAHNRLAVLKADLQALLFGRLNDLRLFKLHLNDNIPKTDDKPYRDSIKYFARALVIFIGSNPELKALDINNNNLGMLLNEYNLDQAFMLNLSQSRLVSLNISRNDLGNLDNKASFVPNLFKALAVCDTIQQLDLSRNRLCSQPLAEWFQHFCDYIEHSQRLTHLRTYGNDLDELVEVEEYETIGYMAGLLNALETNRTLLEFRLDDNELYDAGRTLTHFLARNKRLLSENLTHIIDELTPRISSPLSPDMYELIKQFIGYSQPYDFKSSQTPKLKGNTHRQTSRSLIRDNAFLFQAETSPQQSELNIDTPQDSLTSGESNLPQQVFSRVAPHRNSSIFAPEPSSTAMSSHLTALLKERRRAHSEPNGPLHSSSSIDRPKPGPHAKR